MQPEQVVEWRAVGRPVRNQRWAGKTDGGQAVSRWYASYVDAHHVARGWQTLKLQVTRVALERRIVTYGPVERVEIEREEQHGNT